MSNSKGPSIYIPSDKNVYDALQHKKVTQTSLLSFLRSRGIFVPKGIDKSELSEMIASLTIDYHDYLWITKQLENKNHKEKKTHSTINNNFTDAQIQKACQEVKNAIGDEDSVKIVKTASSTTIQVTYVDTDFTKTELSQRTVKKCEVALDNTDDGLIIKMPSTKKSKEVVNKLKARLAFINGSELDELLVSLENYLEAEARSYFFEELINNIPGYTFDNVSSVDVYHGVDNFEEDEEEEQEKRMAGYINKAVLAGEGVLSSKEFKQLHDRGFFISKIIWTADCKLNGGDRVEFEALFGTPKSCTDYKYLVRGVYNCKGDSDDYNVTRRNAKPKENDDLNALLRKASESAYTAVKDKYEV